MSFTTGTDDVQDPSRGNRYRPRLVTRARRLVVLTLALVAFTVLGGRVLERARLGRDDAEATARVAAEVRRDFADMARTLAGVAASLATRQGEMAAAPGDAQALRALFDAAAAAVGPASSTNLATTVYSVDGTPLAWAGRPSELPRERVAGPEALFVAPGPLGRRLVLVKPVTRTAERQAQRVATIIAERVLPSIADVENPIAGTFVLQTSVVPVVLRTRYEGAGGTHGPQVFLVDGPGGAPLLEGHVRPQDIAAARVGLRRNMLGAVLAILAIVCAIVTLPLGEARATAKTGARYLQVTVLSIGAVVAARALLWFALPPWLAGPPVLPRVGPVADRLPLLLRSPLDFLVTMLAALGLVVIVAAAVERARLAARLRTRARSGTGVGGGLLLLGAAGLAAGILVAYQWLLRATIAYASTDVLRFSFSPWNAVRLELAVGLVAGHAAIVWACVALLRLSAVLAGAGERPRHMGRLVLAWSTPVLIVGALARLGTWPVPAVGIWLPGLLAVGLAAMAPAVARRYRHASQAGRMLALLVALMLPAFSVYPSLFIHAERSKRQLIETRFAPQATSQRDELQRHVRHTLAQIDALPGLADLVTATPPAEPGPVPTDAAFLIWSQTDLARYRLTSAIELYGRDGTLVSRFALNLPEYTSTQQRWQEPGCRWDLFEEVSPFGSEERRLLHAGRGICAPAPSGNGQAPVVGAIVIHTMLDYGTLPFISSQSPYVELFRGGRDLVGEGMSGRDVEFVVYGWSRRPVYMSGTGAWALGRGTFARIYASRTPFWTILTQAGRQYYAYIANDRGGIYVLGYPVVAAIGHLTNLAELGTLVAVTYVALLTVLIVGAAVAGRQASRGRELLREIRASFYRKLLLAFVAAAVIPVLTLAFVARAYMTARLHADVEDAATRTTAVAQRVVEEAGRLQEGENSPVTMDDDVLVWIGRAIDQDVNVFDGPHLIATSERDLFASGLLPTRTSADVYKAIALDRRASYIGEEQAGESTYMVAAAPVRVGGREAILTVPLTLRQQAIEREIDDLTRRIVLAVVAFILAGSALGYWMAERIADPVNRLRRATERIARGDLDARVALTSSDELRRLVEAFNGMAAELQRQQVQLERTHRLEAWADMARQVAHEIKNPLTPIQLSAEHLRRVHVDRGSPLAPVLEGCVDSILTQVRLLRQIAGEFSSFAASPTPRPVATAPAELVAEVVEPYRIALSSRIQVIVDVPDHLPVIQVDRALIGRALTNLIDNALHAMPSKGTLRVTARLDGDGTAVRIAVSDTGVGMDPDALARIFEPYFSTKAAGTGLGLTIAKRNLELHGGTITVESAPGHGTTVTMTVPTGLVPPPPPA